MAITFSKYTTTALLRQMGFPVAPSVRLHQGMPDLEEIAASLGFPCFVKPDQAGSSLGISKVKHASELPQALGTAFAEGPLVMVEGAVRGRELTCGVVDLGDGPVALPICEVRTTHEFFDYEAKYHAADTEEIVPAPVSERVTALVQERSVAIYRSLACRGMVRVDHFWTGEDEGPEAIVTIEVNTVPGFTKASIMPKMLAAAGIDADRLINDMLERMTV
jgi:D-alanine-D-alanine ligase